MSQENLEIVRRSLDAFSRGDLEGVRETLAPGFRIPPFRPLHGYPAGLSRAGGIDRIPEWLPSAWKDVAISIERMEAVDDRVLTLGKIGGEGRESGVAVEAEAAWLRTVNDGLIVDLETFATKEEALEAAGLAD